MPRPDVALGDGHDEAQVRLDERPLRGQAVGLGALQAAHLGAVELDALRLGVLELRRPPRGPPRCAWPSDTSCAAVSSGTLPISFRYMRTGSEVSGASEEWSLRRRGLLLGLGGLRGLRDDRLERLDLSATAPRG